MILYSQNLFQKLLIMLLLSATSLTFAFGQEEVEWLSWEDAVAKSKIEKRKFFVDLYTDWCGWCKKMDKATFAQPEVAAYLNANYYPIKFDAEQKETINIDGTEYKFVRSGRKGFNQLAVEITMGKLSFPTIVFLDEALQVIQPIPGYRGPKEFKMIMEYFGEDHFKSVNWKTYQNSYQQNEQNLSQPVKN